MLYVFLDVLWTSGSIVQEEGCRILSPLPPEKEVVFMSPHSAKGSLGHRDTIAALLFTTSARLLVLHSNCQPLNTPNNPMIKVY